MERLAIYLTDFIYRNGKAEEQDRKIYEYGLETAIETILIFFICAILALSLGMVREGIVFFLIFIPLRAYAGGFHFDKYILCLFCSCFTFLFILYIEKYLRLGSIAFYLIIGLLFIVRLLYPVEHINRPTDDDERKYFMKKLNIYLLIDLFLSYIFFILRKNNILNIIFLTLILITVTMIIGKIIYKVQMRDSKIS